ncbi:MAG: BtpA/SgcQ family protein [Nanoarchaeota archaeon]
MKKTLSDFFNNGKVIFGMIHLAGKDSKEKIDRALDEINIYEEENLNGVIIEDYHGTIEDVEKTLRVAWKLFNIKIGINTLRNPYLAFELANKYNTNFIQFDTIQTSEGDENNPKRFNEQLYKSLREKYSHIFVFGGVRFKYIPLTGKTLEEDITDGMMKCDAIVTTGSGTGIKTPTQKLRDFRGIMGNFPLIIGAGVTAQNVKEQLTIADGAVIGSYFKHGDTEAKVDRQNVRKLVNLARG